MNSVQRGPALLARDIRPLVPVMLAPPPPTDVDEVRAHFRGIIAKHVERLAEVNGHVQQVRETTTAEIGRLNRCLRVLRANAATDTPGDELVVMIDRALAGERL